MKNETKIYIIGGFLTLAILIGSVFLLQPKNESVKQNSYSEKHQLAQSTDGGKSWDKIVADFAGETPLYISFNKQNTAIMYLLTEKNSIFKSEENGTSWKKIR